jgi:hypothetical protein
MPAPQSDDNTQTAVPPTITPRLPTDDHLSPISPRDAAPDNRQSSILNRQSSILNPQSPPTTVTVNIGRIIVKAPPPPAAPPAAPPASRRQPAITLHDYLDRQGRKR